MPEAQVPGGEPGGDRDDDLWPGPTLDETGDQQVTTQQERGGEAPGVKKWPGPTVDGDGDQ